MIFSDARQIIRDYHDVSEDECDCAQSDKIYMYRRLIDRPVFAVVDRIAGGKTRGGSVERRGD